MFIRTDAALHHVRVAGPSGAPAVVFANSLGSDWRIWDGVVDRIGDVRSVRYDMRGHGLTAPAAPPYTIGGLARDLEQILDSLQIRQAVLCGVSVGGMVALQVAAGRSDLAAGLVVCDSGLRIDAAGSWNERIAKVETDGVAAISADVIGRWFTAEYLRRHPDEAAGYRYMLEQSTVAGYVGVCAALRDANLEGIAGAVTCPTLVLCGDRDVATPPDLGRALAGAIPGARFDLIAGAGHLPGIEQPAALAAHLRGMVREVAHA